MSTGYTLLTTQNLTKTLPCVWILSLPVLCNKDQHLSHSFIHSSIIRYLLLRARHAGWSWNKTYPLGRFQCNSNKSAYHPLHTAELPWKRAYASSYHQLQHTLGANVLILYLMKRSLDGKSEDRVLTRVRHCDTLGLMFFLSEVAIIPHNLRVCWYMSFRVRRINILNHLGMCFKQFKTQLSYD